MRGLLFLVAIAAQLLQPAPLRPQRGPFMPGWHALAAAAALLFLLLLAPARADVASVFAEPQPLACGGHNDRRTLGVAHKALPCRTRVELCNSGRCVVARVLDRGPFRRGREWDLMPATAAALGFRDGVHHVTAKVLP